MEGISILFFVAGAALIILIMRAVGAWMLRIDEVISNQRKIIDELKIANENKNNKNE